MEIIVLQLYSFQVSSFLSWQCKHLDIHGVCCRPLLRTVRVRFLELFELGELTILKGEFHSCRVPSAETAPAPRAGSGALAAGPEVSG